MVSVSHVEGLSGHVLGPESLCEGLLLLPVLVRARQLGGLVVADEEVVVIVLKKKKRKKIMKILNKEHERAS